MRWQRVVLFAAIVVAHVLAMRFFAAAFVPHDTPEQEISFATLMVPEPIAQQTSRPKQPRQAKAAISRRPNETLRVTRSAETSHANQDAAASSDVQPDAVPNLAPSIDWAKEARIAADDRARQDIERSRQAAALSEWQSHAMPSPGVPGANKFRWDYAETHRLESSALGLTVNLNDRCSLLISLYMMAIMGGCKIGELPVHGDLFMHMKDDPESSAPAGH
ncbi:MAG: hypothetical protein WDM77_15465 [Steroidobacteraceae bacterium]